MSVQGQRVLAFGTRGDQGTGLVTALEGAGAVPVLASSRPAQVKAWQDEGHQAVVADLTDAAQVVAAARAAGVEAAVLHIPLSLSTAGQGTAAGQAAQALAESGLRVVVNVGSPLPPPGAPDPFGTAPLVEALTGDGATVLGVTAYLENHQAPWALPRLAAGELVYPRPPEDPVAWLTAHDVTAAAVAALDGDHAGHALQLAGPAVLTFVELTDELATGLGRPLTFRQVNPREYGELLRPVVGDAAAEGVAAGYAAMPPGPNPLMARDASATWQALGVTPTPARQWAATHLATALAQVEAA